MKRWTLRILVCLILGAITTVTVAWGCVLSFNYGPPAKGHGAPADVSFALIEPRLSRVERWCALSIGVQYDHFDLAFSDPGIPQFVLPLHWGGDSRNPLYDREFPVQRVARIRTGWPWHCLETRATQFYVSSNVILPDMQSCISLGDEYSRRWLPLLPIGSGFLINTLFYAAIWFGVFLGFASANRFIRIKRGRCPRCGYDLRGALDKGCSECGWNREESAP